jgi:hypothetical protein
MEAACALETFLNICCTTRRHMLGTETYSGHVARMQIWEMKTEIDREA